MGKWLMQGTPCVTKLPQERMYRVSVDVWVMAPFAITAWNVVEMTLRNWNNQTAAFLHTRANEATLEAGETEKD